MKFCKVCLYPDIKPGLEFDNEGMCGACKNNELKSTVDWASRKSQLLEIRKLKKVNPKIPIVSL